MTSPWTEERSNQLKELYANGLSASQIANELQAGLSRNAVIGRIHRLGLEPRGKNGNYSGNGRPLGRPKGAKTGSTPQLRYSPKYKRVIPTFESVEQIQIRCAEIVPMNVSLLDLTPTCCRYPYGDDVITFCGHTKLKGSSYCMPHHEISMRRTHNVSNEGRLILKLAGLRRDGLGNRVFA